MLKIIKLTAVLFAVLLITAGTAGADEFSQDLSFDLGSSIRFGTIAYEDTDGNSFTSPLIGLKFSGMIGEEVRGSYFQAGNDQAVPLRDSEDDIESTVDGSLTSSILQLTVPYKVADNVNAGLGYMRYSYVVDGPDGYVYTNRRIYSGPVLEAVISSNLNDNEVDSGEESINARLGVLFTSWLGVSDHVKGAPGHPDLSTGTRYDGSFLELDLAVGYELYDNVTLKAGYHHTVLKGDGDPDHISEEVIEETGDDFHSYKGYRFLEHEFKHHGFHFGVSYRF